jgi:hypothetical protein
MSIRRSSHRVLQVSLSARARCVKQKGEPEVVFPTEAPPRRLTLSGGATKNGHPARRPGLSAIL